MLLTADLSEAQKTGMQRVAFTDTLADETYLSQFTRYRRYLPFIKYSHNYVEWNEVKAIENFYAKLAKADKRKVKVLHIGDSHIQADFFTGYIRENIQRAFGYGGRGFIFPYACAVTHSTYDYRTWKYGVWEGARNVKNPSFMDIGIAGAVARTKDVKAGFKFGFKEGIIKEDFTTLKIYYKKDSTSFDLKIKLDNYPDTIYVSTSDTSELPYITVELPVASDTFEVYVDKNDSLQTFFECYGLVLETPHNRGILYNSVGINGAGFNHVLNQTLMDAQLAELRPDLVIIDIGANDFYGFPFKEAELRSNLERLISRVKTASPGVSVMVSCAQDIYKKRKNISTAYNFSLLTQTTAGDNACAWYDYYTVAGGRYSMMKWRRYQLAKKDKVHLTTEGYNIKGDLYLNALINSYLLYLKDQPAKLNVGNGIFLNQSDSLMAVADTLDPEKNPNKTKITHVVKRGEKLKSIALKYNVDIEDIMDWNGLESYWVYRGQKMVIYIDKKPVVTEENKLENNDAPKEEVTPAPKPKKETPKTPVKRVKHTVKSGETLSGIAVKYGVTVSQIKKLNNLKTDRIRVGQVLIIK